MGTYFLSELAKFRDDFNIVGDVRGKGLMVGVEMVADKGSCKELAGETMNDIFEDLKDAGLLVGKGGYFGNVSQNNTHPVKGLIFLRD